MAHVTVKQNPYVESHCHSSKSDLKRRVVLGEVFIYRHWCRKGAKPGPEDFYQIFQTNKKYVFFIIFHIALRCTTILSPDFTVQNAIKIFQDFWFPNPPHTPMYMEIWRARFKGKQVVLYEGWPLIRVFYRFYCGHVCRKMAADATFYPNNGWTSKSFSRGTLQNCWTRQSGMACKHLNSL